MTTTQPAVAEGDGRYYPALPIECIRESKENPRKHFDADALKELAESLKTHGQLNACLARPTGGTIGINGAEYPIVELAAGHRRYRAGRLAKLKALQVLVRPMTEVQFIEVLNLENLHREDLHELEEAQGYRKLLELPGYDIDVLAGKVGKSKSYIYQRLKLTELIPEAQKAFLAAKISAGHAILIARLQPKEQAAALKYSTETNRWDGPPSVRDLKQWIQNEILCSLAGAPFKLTDGELHPKAGSCAACPKRTGHQRELFTGTANLEEGGRASGDRCLDPACFQEKVQLFVKRSRTELEKKHPGEPILEISTDYGYSAPKKGEPLPSGHWFDAKKTDPKAKLALVVRGEHSVGQVKYVTTERPRYSSSGTDEKWRAQQRRAQEKQKQEAERRRRIFAGLRANMNGAPLSLDDLRLVASAFVKEMHYETHQKLCTALELEVPKTKQTYGGTHPDHRKALQQHIDGLDLKAFPRFLISLSVAPDLGVASYGSSEAKHLVATATRFGVDVKSIDKDLAAAARAKAAKRKKKAVKVKTSAKRKRVA